MTKNQMNCEDMEQLMRLTCINEMIDHYEFCLARLRQEHDALIHEIFDAVLFKKEP